MSDKKGWKDFFNGFAPLYMNESFTRNTVKEVDFIIEELAIKPGSRILDIGCGTGRHSVELARRGYKMTGVDWSSGMLAMAKKAAEKAGVEVELIQCDAAKYKAADKFDAAICLCEGAFALLGKDDDPLERDLAVLLNINRALKLSGKFVLTTLNAMQKIRKSKQDDVEKGLFDPVNIVETIEMEYDSAGGKECARLREKGYLGSELKLLLKMAGFRTKNVWGGTAGNWGKRTILLDEMEIMAVAVKESGD
ncbi:MAG: cyclopropane-fatty-acyl-phospholipid synthase [candidate division Zixibacteria bacterium HGW-Zixibacteria-1]|nr:MAG: cyclopropane-fatty-acyl-phospholipid synthase [candidate division Zixibacteria bacterium HGW-Zixibacteria-1]